MQFIRYLLVQMIAYGLDMGGFVLFFTYLGISALVANVIGKLLAGLFAFIAHRSFTFGIAGVIGTEQQAVRYFTLLALNIPFSALVLSVTLRVMPTEVVAKLIADVICVFFSYWLSRRFIFLVSNNPPSTITDGGSER